MNYATLSQLLSDTGGNIQGMWGNSPPAVRRGPESVGPDEAFGLVPVAAQGGAIERIGTEAAAWTPEAPATVESVDGDLVVHGNDALAPTVAATRPIGNVDLRRYSSVTATVEPALSTDAAARFRLRLVHEAGGQGRRSRAGHGHGRPAEPTLPSVSSKTFATPRDAPLRLHWDLRGVDDRVLDDARRIELVCERADRPAARGPYGRSATGVRGTVTLSEAALSDSPDALAAARLQNHWQRLGGTLGDYVETVVETRTGDAESGVFRFADGAVDYDFCIHEHGTHVFELDDTVYRFQDGMAGVEPR